ncbi:MAG: hypothetical protein MZU97_07850 [Bacillus subtilis]|nr:hypothetical protein [Bacillus subtilis]
MKSATRNDWGAVLCYDGEYYGRRHGGWDPGNARQSRRRRRVRHPG